MRGIARRPVPGGHPLISQRRLWVLPRQALSRVRPLDDVHIDLAQDPPEGGLELRPLVAAVGVKLAQKREHPEQGGHDQNPTVTILDIGGMDDGVQQQALGVYEEMALLALDLLTRIIPVRVDRAPPFSALFTL
jgi:hypothetical protein